MSGNSERITKPLLTYDDSKELICYSESGATGFKITRVLTEVNCDYCIYQLKTKGLIHEDSE